MCHISLPPPHKLLWMRTDSANVYVSLIDFCKRLFDLLLFFLLFFSVFSSSPFTNVPSSTSRAFFSIAFRCYHLRSSHPLSFISIHFLYRLHFAACIFNSYNGERTMRVPRLLVKRGWYACMPLRIAHTHTHTRFEIFPFFPAFLSLFFFFEICFILLQLGFRYETMEDTFLEVILSIKIVCLFFWNRWYH